MPPDITYGLTANLCTMSPNFENFTLYWVKNAKNRVLIGDRRTDFRLR